MKAIGALARLRGPRRTPSAYGAVPIATDYANARACGQTGGDCVRRARREDIDHAALLKIDEDRPKCCWPFCHAQSSMPTMRTPSCAEADGAPRLTAHHCVGGD
jgi:hypothetical protein